MNDYIILTDSTADLPTEITDEFHIEVLPMKFMLENKIYSDGEMLPEDFYEKIRKKFMISTFQINPKEFTEYFEKYLKNGQNIFYISFSSGLSGTYNSACIAAKELENLYPERQIKIVDSLSASLGEGCLVYFLAKMKQEGCSISKLEKWCNENKSKICHWFIVDDLNHLKRGGRISQTAAFLGNMMSVKPILKVDELGKLCVSEKSRGRDKAIDILCSKLEKYGENISAQTVFISHSDCILDANVLAQKIKDKFGVKKIILNCIGSSIASHVGVGTLALFFQGKKR